MSCGRCCQTRRLFPCEPCPPRCHPFPPPFPPGQCPTQCIGATGATGPTGATGSPGSSTIIPYASGSPVTMSSVFGSTVATVGLIGFGNSISGVALNSTDGSIDLTGTGPTSIIDFAFIMPRVGTITSLNAKFSPALTIALFLALGQSITVNVSVYTAQAGSNTFTNTGVSVTIGTFVGPISIGLGSPILQNSIGSALNLSAGTQVLLVASISGAGLTTLASIVGFISAGISIA